MSVTTELRNPESAIEKLHAGYGGGRPLAPFAVLVSVWTFLFAAFLAISKARGRPLPRLTLGDIVLLAGATAHGARLLSKDAVMAPLRAPFTRYVEPGGPGEVNEEPRKESETQHAIGELLTCPFCLATWVAALFTYGLGLAPRFTRMVAGMFCAIGLANIFQLAYGTATKKAQ
ncbi:MAG: DUF1360 domain-containing protein [Chloroflexi bacterium]|nr:DUF1360 domain-containing protein [Chloroflexota bacterium]